MPILSIGTLWCVITPASMTLVSCKSDDKSNEVDVEISGLESTIDNNKAIKGENFVATITIGADVPEGALNAEINLVQLYLNEMLITYYVV